MGARVIPGFDNMDNKKLFIGQNISGYKHILDYLYDRYYKNFTEHSDVTSAYWKTIGKQEVSKKNGYQVKGHAFGSYRNKSLINQLKHIPMKILLSYHFRKYHIPKKFLQAQETILNRYGVYGSVDSYKQILSYYTILKTLDNKDKVTPEKLSSICIIGDGYGFLANFIKLVHPDIRVISVNLGRTLLFDVLYSEKCFPDVNPLLLITEENKDLQLSTSKIVFIEAENYSLLENLNVDLFINIASMQEMNPEVINEYIKYMRTSKKSPCYFYCCNRVEKELPDGTLIEFKNYIWENSDNVLIDELCPWYQEYPSVRPPFFRSYDGPVQHRLTKLH